jgi:transcriptional regulator with XRE-family HTH domain
MGRTARSGTGNSLAKRLGVSRQRVSALKKKGRVKMIGATVDEKASERMHRERLAAQQTSPSRQLKDLYAAKMSKLEYDKMIGAVVEKAQVEKDAFRIARIIRDTLLRLPDRLAGILASESDQNKIHALLTKELRQVLEALSMTATTEPTS